MNTLVVAAGLAASVLGSGGVFDYRGATMTVSKSRLDIVADTSCDPAIEWSDETQGLSIEIPLSAAGGAFSELLGPSGDIKALCSSATKALRGVGSCGVEWACSATPTGIEVWGVWTGRTHAYGRYMGPPCCGVGDMQVGAALGRVRFECEVEVQFRVTEDTFVHGSAQLTGTTCTGDEVLLEWSMEPCDDPHADSLIDMNNDLAEWCCCVPANTSVTLRVAVTITKESEVKPSCCNTNITSNCVFDGGFAVNIDAFSLCE